MRDDPRTLADEREPVMEPVPAQRSHEEAEGGAEGGPNAGAEEGWSPGDPEGVGGEDRAVGTASVPDPAEVQDAEAHDGEGHDAEGHDTVARDAEAHDAEVDDARARDDEFRPADAEAPDMAGAESPAGESADAAAGGVPDDAVSAADAPVPAAAYSAGSDDLAERDARQDEGWQGDAQPDEARQDGEPHGELMPGDVPEQPVSALFDESTASGFRDRWQQVQMQFVDDPRIAADQARTLVDDVFTALHEGLTKQRGALDGWQSGQPDDTEQLRVAVRRYRDFLDRMLGV